MVEDKLKNLDSFKLLKTKLLELFRADKSDLDFGIYRIINQKRAMIERFIENDLLKTVADEFNKITQKEQTSNDTAINQTFNDLYNFFSRYYEDGDFITQFRISSDGFKYAIPFNGEEVKLHWATQDQYFVKNSNIFDDYSFKHKNHTFVFKVTDAEVPVNNTKDSSKKYFLLKEVSKSETNDTTEIKFEYKALSDEENKQFAKKTQSKSKKQKKEKQAVGETDEEDNQVDDETSKSKTESSKNNKISQDTINEKIIKEILKEVDNDEIKKELGSSVIKSDDDEIKKEPSSPVIKSDDDDNTTTTLLGKHISAFTRKKTSDFFIHKNLKGFLTQQLDYYIKSEVLNIDDLSEFHLKRVNVVRDIATKLIDLLSQIEEFQKNLWEKKKFVLKTEYVITSDRLPECLYEEVLKNESQRQEWIDLGIIKTKDKISKDEIVEDEIVEDEIVENEIAIDLKKGKLPIDTKYFTQEFKEQLLTKLSEKHSIDDYLDGILIKSENWQALNLLLEKYREHVQTIYIDPPFNTGKDSFYYKDFYRHSSWVSMIIDRLDKAKYFLKDSGFIFVSIDDNELYFLKQLMDNEFGSLNFITNFIWRKRAGGGSDSKFVAIDHEYVVCYAKNANKSIFYRFSPNEKNYPFYDFDNRKYAKKPLHNPRLSNSQGLHYDITCPDGSILKGAEHQWVYNKNTFDKLNKEGKIIFVQSKNKTWKVMYKHYMDETQGEIPRSILYDISLNSFGVKEHKCLGISSIYNYPKPSTLISYFVEISSVNDKDIIFDFFAGSGTTAESVLKINQKYNRKLKFILIEMDNYFESIIIPRIKKLSFSLNWGNGKPKDTHWQGGGFFKYQYLEQYEDTLHNILFNESKQKDLFSLLSEESKQEYIIKYMLDYETKESPTRLTISKFETPFDYKIKVISNNKGEEVVAVDLVETFNYLIGLKVNKIQYAYNQQDNNRKYVFVEGEINNNKIAVIWRDTTNLDNKTDNEFIEKNLEDIQGYEGLYINGDSSISHKKINQIESVFLKHMGVADAS
ncbi:MAG: site-specific DNA-methyltransferase [Candidatus Woesearchaeota archaeon]